MNLNIDFFPPFCFLLLLQLSWNRGGWGWTTSFRGSPRTPTPASSEYHLTHVIVPLSRRETWPEMPVSCRPRKLCGFHTSWFTLKNNSCFWCKVWTLCHFFFFLFLFTVLKFSPFWTWVHRRILSSWTRTRLLLWVYLHSASCVYIAAVCRDAHTHISSVYHVFILWLQHPHPLLSLPPQPSPSQQINLGPSSNPSAKPSDFHFLKVIGKGSFGKVLLARHRTDDQFYAVKVLQKKAILKKKEVNARKTSRSAHTTRGVSLLTSLIALLFVPLRRSTSCRRGMCC